MRPRFTVMAVVVFACAIPYCGCRKNTDNQSPEAPKVSSTLRLTGSGLDKPATFTFEQLAGRTMARLDKVLMRKSHEEDEITSWEGPALADLLAEAKIKAGNMRVTLVAKDGYEMQATLEDMKDAVVALKDGEGHWLFDVEEDCALRLVPPHKPGNFWIMNLSAIRFEPADGGQPSE